MSTLGTWCLVAYVVVALVAYFVMALLDADPLGEGAWDSIPPSFNNAMLCILWPLIAAVLLIVLPFWLLNRAARVLKGGKRV